MKYKSDKTCGCVSSYTLVVISKIKLRFSDHKLLIVELFHYQFSTLIHDIL